MNALAQPNGVNSAASISLPLNLAAPLLILDTAIHSLSGSVTAMAHLGQPMATETMQRACDALLSFRTGFYREATTGLVVPPVGILIP
jgi:hypothetical protein